MDLKSEVYNAAREGKINRLKIYLDHRPKDEIAKAVTATTNGATPLIVGSRNGHLLVVEYLIEKCSADLEQVGSVTFDGETIDGAPPLWCAAAAGHLDIVKYLINAGAQVNHTTFTNSTPLRAACFDGHFQIVQYLIEHKADIEIANRHGHTCLMISCYKGHLKIVKYLVEKNADINRKSLKGNTALHDCAESGSLDILKLLISHNARMEKDSYKMTPLLAAAVTGHIRIVEYLITRPESTKLERIEALELLGATYVDKKRDMLGALKLWRLALTDRFGNPNNIIDKVISETPVPAYENAIEFRTVADLDKIIADPDEMRMQALLVRERILGPAHPDTSYYIRYRGAVYADMGNFSRCVTLWMYALDMQQKILDPLCPMTQSSFLSFAELFSFMMSEGRNRKPYPVEFRDMLVVFKKAVRELELGMTHLAKTPVSDRDSTQFNRLLVIIMHLLSLACKTLQYATKDDQLTFKTSAYRMIRMNPRGLKGFTPLHLACFKETTTVGRYPVCAFPSTDVVSLLVEVGASVNALDLDHNTPLHIAALNKNPKPEVFKVLLDCGAHIDFCNLDGKSALEIIRGIPTSDVICPMNYISLQCLAARRIVSCELPYQGAIPKKLEAFVRMH